MRGTFFKGLPIGRRDRQRHDLRPMLYKHNASRHHRVAKMKFKVTNWPEYEAGLRRRGSLTLWLTEEALARWHAPRRTTRGGQPRYSDLAIEAVLTLGCVFGLRLRQSEGLTTSLLDLMGPDLPVPDHTTLSRRAQIWEPSAKRQRHPEDGPLHVLIDSTGFESLRRRPMAGRQARCQITPDLAQAAFGSQCRQRRDHRPLSDRPGRRRSLAGEAAARPDRRRDRPIHGRRSI